MSQPSVCGVVMLVLLIAACFTQLEERWVVAAEHTASEGGALQVLITTSELMVDGGALGDSYASAFWC